MWSSYQTLNQIASAVLFDNRIDQLMEFKALIKLHRMPLLLPMHKQKKSVEDRQLVKKADVEAISIPGLSQRIILTHDLIEETCNLSDLFDVNETTALELLLTAEGHLSSHSSSLSRSSLAITLYFDAYRAVAETLGFIIQCRSGRIPLNTPLSRDVENVIHSFTDDLWQCGLLHNLLSFLSKFNLERELKSLETARVLDGRKHRRDILRLLTQIRNHVAECVMFWTVQTPLSSSEMSQVLTHLVDPKFSIVSGSNSKERGLLAWDHGSVHLLMALLFSLEPFSTSGSVDQYADAAEQDLQHPLFSETGYLTSVTELLILPIKTDQQNLSPFVEEMYSLLQIAWGIALRRTAHLRTDLRRRGNNSTPADCGDSVDEDELVTSGLRSRAIDFLCACILSEPYFSHEPLWVRRIHGILTDLLIHFPQNTRDLRLWDESAVRRMGVDPGSFAVLLDAIGRLYNVPGSPMHARLSLEYWWPAGETRLTSAQMSDTLNVSFRAGEVENSRQAILFRFVFSTSEFASSPIIFVPYVRMLRSLVGCQTSANLCFNLLKTTGSSGGQLVSLLTWDHFISSLHQYLEHLKRSTAFASGAGVGGQPLHVQHPHLYHHSAASSSLMVGDPHMLQQQMQSASAPPEIQPEELEALRAVVALIARVCVMDPVARSSFASNTKWCLISTVIALITCPLSMSMKADLLYLLSALCHTPAIASEVWCALMESRLFSFIEHHSHSFASSGSSRNVVGLHTEMDKVEARQEEYPITQAFINLLTTLAPSLLNSVVSANELTSSAMVPCEALSRLVHFTIETIFLKHTMRAYRRQNERWEVAASCVVLFEGLVSNFLSRMRSLAILTAGAGQCNDEQLSLFDWTALLGGHLNAKKLNLSRNWPFTDPGYQIATQLLTNSSLFSLLTGLLEVGLYRLLEYSATSSSCAMVRATAAILRLFDHILLHEQMLVNLVRRAALVVPHLRPETAWGQRSGADVILPTLLSRLLVVTINSRTGRADLLVTIIRYCGVSDDLPDHCTSALNIFYSVVRAVQPHESVLSVFTNDKKTEQELLHALVSCFTSLYKLSDGGYPVGTSNKSPPIFSDSWLYADAENDMVYTNGLAPRESSSCYHPHPALNVMRVLAAFPTVPCDWNISETQWELMAIFPPSVSPFADLMSDACSELDVIWSLGNWRHGQMYLIRSTMLHLILYALTNHPSPSIAHWLLGFRCKKQYSIALTTLQDAGVGGFPRTCLHEILDLLELAVASLRENSVVELEASQPHISLLTQQWDAAMGWQILYRLTAATTTAVPTSRYLRGNHDLIARHLTTGLVGVLIAPSPLPSVSSEDLTKRTLQSLVLNQCSWLLKMAAIEVQASTSQRTYLARLLTSLFALDQNPDAGDAATDVMDRIASVVTYADQTEPQTRILSDLLSRMAPSEELPSPQWIFECDCAESTLVEDILLACEEAFPLISAEGQMLQCSGIINTASLISRLTVFLGINAGGIVVSPDTAASTAKENVIESSGLLITNTTANTDVRLAADVVNWARQRNAHRLVLKAGKQACLEGWRHLAEIGLRMLHFMARASPDTLTLSVSSTGANAGTAINHCLYATTMMLINPLLYEVSAPESTPAVLKVLASGSCLSLTAFLQLFALPVSGDWSILPPKVGGAQGILTIVQLLLEAVLTSKPTQQRVRANYYGALCHVLDVCHRFDQRMSVAGACSRAEVSITLQAINILSDGDGKGVSSSFLVVLFSDIFNGHHPIIPMSALGLLCFLLKLDRASGHVLETVIREGCLQFCVDSLEDDLAILQQHLMSQGDNLSVLGRDENETKTQADVTAVFYVYQSKMAFLALAASTHLGAKFLIYTPLLDSTFCRFEPLSGSCLADVFNLSVATAGNVTASDEAQSDPLGWLDTYEFSQHLLHMLNQQEVGEPDGGSLIGLVDPIITSQLLSVSGSGFAISADSGQSLTWIGIVAPALAFAKALFFTLGPTHVAAVQKASKFIYTHSDALLTVGASASAARLVSALTQEYFQDERDSGSVEKQKQLILATLQWLDGEESLAFLLSFILRSRIPSNLGDPDDLPRELLRSKTLHHVFAIMPDLLQALQIKDYRALEVADAANTAKQIFVRNLVITKQLHLLGLLVNTCVAAVSVEDVCDGFDTTFIRNLIFSSSLSANDSNNDVSLLPVAPSSRPGLHLLFQLVTWSASRLHHAEGLLNSLSRHLPSNSFLDFDSEDAGDEEVQEERKKAVGVSSLDKILRCLVQLPMTVFSPAGEISTDSLRQIATNVFSVWTPVAGPLLQTSTASGADASQRNAYLRRFISLGGGLLQTQVTSLIDILEQATYLLWRHLACYLASVGKPEMTTEIGSNENSSRGCCTRRLLASEFIEQLPRKLSFDLLDSITQVSKARYLSSNDQLFLQVMVQRLDRISQMRNTVAAAEHVN